MTFSTFGLLSGPVIRDTQTLLNCAIPSVAGAVPSGKSHPHNSVYPSHEAAVSALRGRSDTAIGGGLEAFPRAAARPCVTSTLADAGYTRPALGPREKGTRGPLPRDVSDSRQRRRLEGEGRRGTMAQRRKTEDEARRATCQPWVWERLTGTILTLVGVAGVGLLTWTITGGVPLGDARLALAALLVYVALCTLIVRGDQAIKEQGRATRAEDEERRQRLRRRPYSVMDEAEAVLTHAQGRRET